MIVRPRDWRFYDGITGNAPDDLRSFDVYAMLIVNIDNKKSAMFNVRFISADKLWLYARNGFLEDGVMILRLWDWGEIDSNISALLEAAAQCSSVEAATYLLSEYLSYLDEC